MTTLVVLGAGDLGGAVAQCAVSAAAVRRVVIVDAATDVARGKALDIRQSSALLGQDVHVEGTSDLSAVIGAAAIVVAGRHGDAGEWRDDDGLRLLDRVREFNPDALIVCAGATQLDLVDRAVIERDFARARIVGSAPEALRSAATAFAALEAGTAPGDVCLTFVGRPPATAFVPWDTASIAGDAAVNVLSPPALTRLDARIHKAWPPGPLVLGAAAVRIVSLALSAAPGHATVYAVHESAARGLALPARLGARGVQQWLMPRLTARDQVRLDGARAR